MADWETKTLGELCEFQRGLTYGKSDEVDASKNVVLRANNVDLATHTLDLTDLRYISNSITIPAAKKVRKGSLLICTASGSKSHLGKIAYVDEDYGYAFGGFMGQITPTPGIYGRYLFHALTSSKYKAFIEALSDGVNINNLKFDDLRQFSVSVPPLPEQQRIVAILDEAFEAIATAKASAEKNLQNARELFDSKLLMLLSDDERIWTRKTLKEVSVDFGRGKSKHRPRNDPKLYGGPYPFIQTGDVRGSDHLITEYTQTYSEAGLAQSKLWPRGTLCITIAANIAETGVLNFDACFPDSVIGVVVDDAQTTSKYLEYMLHTVKADLKAKGKGSAQDNINLGTFENERFPFPDLLTQKRVVGLLDDLSAEVQRLEDVYARKLSALDELKKSLLHQAFTGQL
jgi:type I restriction enzyme S subunit